MLTFDYFELGPDISGGTYIDLVSLMNFLPCYSIFSSDNVHLQGMHTVKAQNEDCPEKLRVYVSMYRIVVAAVCPVEKMYIACQTAWTDA